MERESLLKDVQTGYDLVAFRESSVGKFLLAKAVVEIKAALSELADVDPTDMKKIVELQSKVRVARGFRDWIEEGIAQAAQAQEILDEANLDWEFEREAAEQAADQQSFSD